MATITVNINGKAYPCRPTMGAALRFKRETGKEVTAIDGSSLEEVITYLYCCVVSACAVDKIDFDYDLLAFADSLNPEDLQAWTASLTAGTTGNTKGAKKK